MPIFFATDATFNLRSTFNTLPDQLCDQSCESTRRAGLIRYHSYLSPHCYSSNRGQRMGNQRRTARRLPRQEAPQENNSLRTIASKLKTMHNRSSAERSQIMESLQAALSRERPVSMMAICVETELPVTLVDILCDQRTYAALSDGQAALVSLSEYYCL